MKSIFDQDPDLTKPAFDPRETDGDAAADPREKTQQQETDQPTVSREDRIQNLQDEVTALKQEVESLSESAEATKERLSETRAKLGLSPSDEDPSSVTLETDRIKQLEAKQVALERKKAELESEDQIENQALSEQGEAMKENDLIISEFGRGPAKEIFEKNGIRYQDREYSKRQVLDTKTDTAVPGEFVLTISDPEHPDQPATVDFVKQVYKLIKDADIAVRYGKNPEQG